MLLLLRLTPSWPIAEYGFKSSSMRTVFDSSSEKLAFAVSSADVLPGAENFFVVVTHSGVTLSPILGRLIAEFIESGVRPRELLPYSLTRFPGFQ